MKNKFSRLSTVAVLIAVVIFANQCGSKVLGTYKDGKVTEKDVKNYLKVTGMQVNPDPNVTKRIVHDIVLLNALSVEAEKESLDKDPDAVYFEGIYKNNILRQELFNKNRSKYDDDEEKVYHARHILVKTDPSAPGAPAGISKSEMDAELKIEQIYADITSGKISFVDAVKQYSDDGGSKAKDGDLGYFTSGIMVPDFESEIKRLSGESEGVPARVLTDKVPVHFNAEKGSPVITSLGKGVTVDTVASESKGDMIKIHYGNIAGFIEKQSLKELSKSDKISNPVKTQYGWHIIELLDDDSVDKDGYAKLILKTQFEGKKESADRAENMANMYWERVKRNQIMEWQNNVYKSFGLAHAGAAVLEPDWQKKSELLKSDKFTVTREDFEKYLNWISKDQNMDLKTIMADINMLQRYFRFYVDSILFSQQAIIEKIDQTKEYKSRMDIERKRFLSELYKKKHWYGEEKPVTDAMLKSEYDKIKGMNPNIPPFAQMRERIKQQVVMRDSRMNVMRNEETYLQSISFQLVEKNFK